MTKRKIPKVNMYDAELKLEKLVEQAQKDKSIKKPISWAAVLGRVDGANYCSECGAEMEGEEC